MKNFALIGAAGYIAPRHMKAIKETGNNLIAALDKHDNVGILDSYFPEVHFFTEFERFDRHIDKIRRSGVTLDYVTICSPNYLHDSHIRFALRHGANAICEKPLVLNPWNADALIEVEKETGKKIFTILQLRLHPRIKILKEQVEKSPAGKIFDVELTYITSRGRWYDVSWKGDELKSGGIATNIGIHFFDMLIWVFGKVKNVSVTQSDKHLVSGQLQLEKARVNWTLSIDYNQIPEHIRAAGKRTYRILSMNGEEIEFSDGFTDLHTESYRQILNNHGFSVNDARDSIELASKIRSLE